MNFKMYCIICQKEIGEDIETPHSATVWSSSGNYGSRIIDSSGNDFGVDEFILAVCDVCLVNKSRLILSIHDPSRHVQPDRPRITGTLEDKLFE